MKLLKSQEGATSVLVVFMMIVLVTFGAFALTGANVNLKLSSAALEWNAVYYAMDGEAQEILFDADRAVAEAAAASDNGVGYYDAVAEAVGMAFILSDTPVDFEDGVITYTVTNEQYNLSVSAELTPYGSSPRLNITRWREWQTPREAAPPPVWDGTIPVN